MATIHDEIPSLDGLLDSILDRLPNDVVASLAAMSPRPADPQDETFADQLVRMTQARAAARVGGADDDRQARIREAGDQVVKRHESVFRKLAE